MLLRALSTSVLKISKDGDCTTLLSNLFQCLSVLVVKKIFPLASLSLSFQLMLAVSPLPIMHHYEEPGSIIIVTSM